MGQAMRMMQYDRAANEANAVSALKLAGIPLLQWFRLDDGVMGGMSKTEHIATTNDGILQFVGTINTNGGGFTSIRARIPEGTLVSTEAIKLTYRGDGKTYKLILSDGNRSTGGPFGRSPSWQADLPTKKMDQNEWETRTVSLSTLLPNFGSSMKNRPPEEEKKNHSFNSQDIREIGLMLSLKLSSGEANPKETFGEGIFPFSLLVKSIETVPADNATK